MHCVHHKSEVYRNDFPLSSTIKWKNSCIYVCKGASHSASSFQHVDFQLLEHINNILHIQKSLRGSIHVYSSVQKSIM